MTKINIGSKGTAKIAGLGFSYEISKIHKKRIAPINHLFLRIVLPYRSMMFSGIAKVKVTDLHEDEFFYRVCHELLQSIMKDNPILAEALLAENS